MLMEVFRLAGLLLGLLTVFTGAFVVPAQPLLLTQQQRALVLAPLMAGFGASSSKGKASKKDSGKKASKLKPKKQWDRYTSEDLKSADSIRVAVRVVDRGPAKWFSSGEIKSKDNAYTEAAVIRHRALIADHARRMFPAEVLALDKLDYGYTTDTNDDIEECEWKITAKVEDMPADIDKMIGFRGFPDLTGFYSSSGKAATGDTTQDGYANMKSKGILGVTRLEVHD
mmetsp:Transcript_22350/g.48475  ORF Transcript_22350/g.48475 Transcript_22350/m.48475 type:complete len:227 (+) Transcript_22350:119-799(+)|eukprot:CAMPEP_0172297260 /NCGR_PEP_ID=MMETSP1058-20130122/352_1 /TAXON_ID=83371 /ORGANISM="Detonula confervacea, Strain CCMP 353" /LENGTH=226 /DNA_ID=CAMNT_0013006389 /DNA_START=119 /DNA_END=799 /DNA_ORIENTATION=+